MPSEHRMVEIAAGTKRRGRLGRQEAVSAGYVRLQGNRHHADVVVEQRRWDEGTPA